MKNSRSYEGKTLPPLSLLRQCFQVNGSMLTWAIRPLSHFSSERDCGWWNGRYAGKEAGSFDQEGYRCVTIDGKKYRAHRVVYALHHGIDPVGHLIDHKDGNITNNRIENLRIASNAQNQHNTGLAATNKSGVKGLLYLSRSRLWRASLRDLGKRYCKEFKNREDAMAWLKKEREERHGEFANGGWLIEEF